MTNSLPWNEIETVLLDMDGTLLDLHFDNYFWEEFLPKHYAVQQNISEQDAHEKIKIMYAEKHGQLEWYSIDYWQDTLEVDMMTLKQQEAHRIEYRPYCLEFLDFLQQQNIEAVLVTNAHPKSLQLKMSICPLHASLSQLFSSHQFHVAKEHPDFWYRFEKSFAFNKQNSLFIDDNNAVLKNAQRYGIKHLRSIKWPDNQRNTPNISDFPLIESFKNIII